MSASQLPVTIMTRLLHEPCSQPLEPAAWETSAHAFALVVLAERDRFPLLPEDGAQEALSVNRLANGCLLCKVGRSLAQSLDDLLRQHAAGRHRFARLVMVTQADQIAAVADLMFTHQAIGRACMLDVIVLWIDAVGLVRRQVLPAAWTRHIAVATDIVIANSALLCAAALALLRRRIARINQHVRVRMPARSAGIDQMMYLGAALHR